MKSEYLPIDPDFYELMDGLIKKRNVIAVNYFDSNKMVSNIRGKIEGIIEQENFEKYLLLDTADKVRLDRIITFNGRPGPAYDEYDSYALACLDCMGGMD